MKVGQIGLGYWGPKLLRNLVAAIGAENVIACDLNIDRVADANRDYPGIGVSLNVDDVAAAAEFLTTHFGFRTEMAADGFASLARDDAG